MFPRYWKTKILPNTTERLVRVYDTLQMVKLCSNTFGTKCFPIVLQTCHSNPGNGHLQARIL